LEAFGKNDDASKTSSISLRYVMEVIVPETPVIVQPCSLSIASTFPASGLDCDPFGGEVDHTFKQTDFT
jgi:hypothetical protein